MSHTRKTQPSVMRNNDKTISVYETTYSRIKKKCNRKMLWNGQNINKKTTTKTKTKKTKKKKKNEKTPARP